MSNFITTVVSHTPIWVWFLLKGLIVLGLVQTRDREVGLFKVLAMPVGLGFWSLVSAGQAFGWSATTLVLWAGAWALGLLLQPWLMPAPSVQALAAGRWTIAGSWAPLALILVIFFVRYSISASLAVVPELANLPAFAVPACLLYGLPSGLLAARARRVLGTPAVAAASNLQAQPA